MKYVDMTVESEDSKETLARLVFCVHGFNATRPLSRVALSFPDFQEAVFGEGERVLAYPKPGSRLRLFGEEADLADFVASPGVARLVRLGIARASVRMEIPIDAVSERFVRDRKLHKTYQNNAYARRQRLRAQEQGRPYVAKKKTVEPSVRFEMRSKTSELDFLLDIRREICGQREPWLVEINAYGLSTAKSSTPRF